jgi:hypothetical protein
MASDKLVASTATDQKRKQPENMVIVLNKRTTGRRCPPFSLPPSYAILKKPA